MKKLALGILFWSSFFVLGFEAQSEPRHHVIEMVGMGFVPDFLELQAGDTVTWVNRDFFPHTATAINGAFDSRIINGQGSWGMRINEKGEFTYVCHLHSMMKGTLVVK